MFRYASLLVIVALVPLVEALARTALRGRLPAAAKWGWRAAGLYAAIVALWLSSLERDERMALPFTAKLFTTVPITAMAVSAFTLVAFAALWWPLTRWLSRHHADAPATPATPASATTTATATVTATSTAAAPDADAAPDAAAGAAPAPDAVAAAAPAPEPFPTPLLLTRRRFLSAAAFAPPAALASVGPMGVLTTTFADGPILRRLTLRYPNLPPALDGLTIVQATDIHVGHFVDAPALERAMERVDALKPDLFVITGDVIDDLGQLDRTAAALASVKARLGSFAIPGNHEHYAGFSPIRKEYDRRGLPLLVDESVQLRKEDATLELSGVDFAFSANRLRPRGFPTSSFEERAELAMGKRGTGGDFKLHLCHHPEGFDAAADRGAQLVLSGHTHGGQVAILGRPLFAPAFKYMLGLYERPGSRLYVSPGTGHWLPVRIGCPAELTHFTLRRA